METGELYRQRARPSHVQPEEEGGDPPERQCALPVHSKDTGDNILYQKRTPLTHICQ